MSRLQLDYDPTLGMTRKRLVYVGDSVGQTPQTGDTQEHHKRIPSLLGKSLCARGYQEWSEGFDGAQHYYFGWHYDGTADGIVDNSGTSSGPWDVEVYYLTDSGESAYTWASPVDGDEGHSDEPGTYGAERCDVLVVQFGFNDMNVNAAGTSAAVMETAMHARLDEWTNVGRKFLVLGYSPYDSSYPRFGINEGKSAYWTAAVNAAAAADPGDQQDEVQIVRLPPYGLGDGVRNGFPLDFLNADTTHVNRIGAQIIARAITAAPGWPGIRIPY